MENEEAEAERLAKESASHPHTFEQTLNTTVKRRNFSISLEGRPNWASRTIDVKDMDRKVEQSGWRRILEMICCPRLATVSLWVWWDMEILKIEIVHFPEKLKCGECEILQIGIGISYIKGKDDFVTNVTNSILDERTVRRVPTSGVHREASMSNWSRIKMFLKYGTHSFFHIPLEKNTWIFI